MSAIAKRYSSAIFELLDGNIKKDLVNKELKEMADLFRTNEEFRKVILNPIIDIDVKGEILKSLLKSLRYSDLTEKSLYHILEANRFDILPDISESLSKKVDISLKRQYVNIITARKLSELALSPVRKEVERVLDGKKVIYNYEIDETIIGGVVVKINDNIYDFSIKKSLDKIKESV